jgi:hypothetical protein
MRNLLFSVFAIGVAAVAAITATTAMLNAPHRIGPATEPTAQTTPQMPAPPPSDSRPAVPEHGKPATPGGTPDAGKPATVPGAAKDSKDASKDDEGDKDPYEGIAPEELPPDLQYSADSSVSFPTNI